jgi:hypothetical protein
VLNQYVPVEIEVIDDASLAEIGGGIDANGY